MASFLSRLSDFLIKQPKTTALNSAPGAALLNVSYPSPVHHSHINSNSESAADCLRFFAYREAGRTHLLGDRPHHFQLFGFFISFYLDPQIELASLARQIGQTSCIHLVLNRQGVTACCTLSWGYGNTSIGGGFTCHLCQEAVALLWGRFQRWTEHQTTGEDDCLITLRDTWVCPELADAARRLKSLCSCSATTTTDACQAITECLCVSDIT